MLQTSCQSQCTGLTTVNIVNLKSKILERVLSCIMTLLMSPCNLYIGVQPACSGIGQVPIILITIWNPYNMNLINKLLTRPKVIKNFLEELHRASPRRIRRQNQNNYELTPNTLEDISLYNTISVYHSHRLPREVFYDSLS